MDANIKQLSSSVSKLLTTTQVITSPSNVVKELIENSLDAKADSISVRLESFGLEKVEVTDNGTGIAAGDAPLMARPGYTSKIRELSDLEQLGTYGFRGQGLAAVASLADVTVSTRTDETEVGSAHLLDGDGRIMKSSQCCMNRGTIVSVTKLFKNVPVRHKVYSDPKRKKEELRKIEELIKCYGIVQPHVRLALYHERIAILQKGPAVDLASSLRLVLGSLLVNLLERVCHRSSLNSVVIEAYLPKVRSPVSSMGRSQTDMTFTFVNKRPVKLPMLYKLFKYHYCQANSVSASPGRYPVCCVCIEVPPNQIDCNINPEKTLLFFSNKDEVATSIEAVLMNLYGTSPMPKTVSRRADNEQPTEEHPDDTSLHLASSDHLDARNHETTNAVDNPELETMSAANGRQLLWDSDDEMDVRVHVAGAVSGGGKRAKTRHKSGDATANKESPLTSTAVRARHQSGQLVANGGQDLGDKFCLSDRNCTKNNGEGGGSIRFDGIKTNGFDGPRNTECNFAGLAGTGEPVVRGGGTEWSRGALEDEKGIAVESVRLLTATSRPKAKRQMTLDSWPSLSGDCNESPAKRRTPTAFNAASDRSNTGDVNANTEKAHSRINCVKLIQRNGKKDDGMKIVHHFRSPEPITKKPLECKVQFDLKKMRESCLSWCSTQNSWNGNDSYQSQPKERDTEIVGRLCNGFWVVSRSNNLEIVNHFRLWECRIYGELLENYKLVAEPLRTMTLISESEIGHKEWQTLVNLTSSKQIQTGPRSVISDRRINDNGFNIARFEAPEDNRVAMYLTGVVQDAPQLGIADLKECLGKISATNSTLIAECRPSKVEEYLKNTATDLARAKTKDPTKKEVLSLLNDSKSSSVCLHGRPLTTQLANLSPEDSTENLTIDFI